ncbi:MAG TPA: histidine kinase, partial [Candidatus Synoicihabitans sp.]|nr:histidine kinase [Candidatus Synoicihabitans sp.]
LLGVLAAVAIRLRDERRRAVEARLSAARLEVELLRKNLQPHFFLNTLTALSEVVERNPSGAVRLIEDMAEGFRALSRMSGEKQVPLAQELELCRAHLRVMNVRTGVACRLQTECVDGTEPVPPALFLTLIENGFAHQQVREGVREFVLRATPLAGAARYTFFSPGEIKVRPARAEGGTGLRYVKARLEESFAERWLLRHEAVPGGWETVIEIQCVPGARLAEQPDGAPSALLSGRARCT